MQYLIINPYSNAANHGIANYIDVLQKIVTIDPNKIAVVTNKKNLNPTNFRKYIYEYVTANYGYNEVIIEAPEAKASTLLLPKEYNVHIRLHCPLAVAQFYDGKEINQIEYSHELRVINKATIVSSPSFGLLDEIDSEIRRQDIFVYKNPILTRGMRTESTKKYDVVFMGRYQPLKGSEELNKVLETFPKNYRVLVFGNNCRSHKLSPHVQCNVSFKNEIRGEERFELISQSKCLIQLSRFENCSMVILESLSCYVPVVCWNVGGNGEIANRDVLHTIDYLNFEAFRSSVKYFIDNPPSAASFQKAINRINQDFQYGIEAVLNNIAKDCKVEPYLGIDYSNEECKLPSRDTFEKSHKAFDKKIRVLGIAYSNEHVEELWAPVVSYLGFDSRYICRRPKGFHTVFNHEPYPVNDGHYTQFNWLKDLSRLEKIIVSYKPNLILFHNGLHPSYQDTLKFIKSFNIPIIYSELGWFPQKDHVYFDPLGVNAKSYIAKQDFLSFTGEEPEYNIKEKLQGQYALLALQLENDTNLIVSSPDYKRNINIIKYVYEQIGHDTIIAVKPHPLDKNIEEYKHFCNKHNLIFLTNDIKEALSNAHSVIAVNSTVLLEALEYRCNIYALGNSILENKNVVVSCQGKSLKKNWLKELHYSEKNRKLIIEGFKKRQINLLDIRNGKPPQFESIKTFFDNVKLDVSLLIAYANKLEPKINLNIKERVQSDQIIPTIKDFDNKLLSRKLNKFRHNPWLFMKDFLKKWKNNDRKGN